MDDMSGGVGVERIKKVGERDQKNNTVNTEI